MSTTTQVIAPANIAFIKYWGKRKQGCNWPANDSLSMTLSSCTTKTSVKFTKTDDHQVHLNGAWLDRGFGKGEKVFRFLDNLHRQLGLDHPLQVITENNFPTGSGIASSASGFAALTMAALLTTTSSRNWAELEEKGWPRKKIADLARLGSGSACRSIYGGIVEWQAGTAESQQSVAQLHNAKFWPLADTVAIVSPHEKNQSSSHAHKQAWTSPLFLPRIEELGHRTTQLKKGISSKNLHILGPIIEQEALEMHAVIMTSKDPIHYLTSESLRLITAIRRWRYQQHLPVYFTIDAGPNIHMISEITAVEDIKKNLAEDFPGMKVIFDQTGQGPEII